MEENRFERQVRQKMDELKIPPSGSVWEKVEARIEKNERSKRGLILMLLGLFALVAGGGYLLWNRSHSLIISSKNIEKNISQKNSPETTNNVISFNKNKSKNGAADSMVFKESARINSPATKPAIKLNKGIIPGLQPPTSDTTSRGEKIKTAQSLVHRNKQASIKKSFIVQMDPEPAIEITLKNKRKRYTPGKIKIDIKSLQSENKLAANDNQKAEEATTKNVIEDSLSRVVRTNDTIAKKDTSNNKSYKAKSIAHTNSKKWKFAISFSGGVSAAGSNILGVDKSALSYSTPAGQVTTPSPSATPSKTTPGFGYMAGVFAEKTIFSKTKIVVGMNFKSFSTSIRVGTRNTTTDRFNSDNAVNLYKNHYSFIEVPVNLKVQIGNGKLPIFWQGGIVLSELISINALQFNSPGGYYYTDNSLFNKAQIGVNTAISAAIFSKTVLIGPAFYYNTSSLSTEGLYQKKHFVFIGLQAEFLLGK